MKKLLIYGSTGYIGRLIAEKINTTEFSVLLGGRDEIKLRSLSDKLHYEYRVFTLNNGEVVYEHLRDIDIIINAAGPQVEDIENLIEACIENRTHFIDLAMHPKDLIKFNLQAKQSDVMLLSGAGHSFLPLDCLGGFLLEKMPNAQSLSVYVSGVDTISRGTAKGNLSSIKEGIYHRIDGRLKKIKSFKSRYYPNSNKTRKYVPSSFGIPTLTFSTGIENIESFFESTYTTRRFTIINNYFSWILKFKLFHDFIEKKISKLPDGPSEKEREGGKIKYIAFMKDKNNNKIKATLTTPEVHDTTCLTTITVLENIKNNFCSGFQTPYKLFGSSILKKINGFDLQFHEAS